MLQSITITELTAIWVVRDDHSRRGYYMKYEGNCPHYQLVYKLFGKNRLLFDGQEYEERENSFRFLPKGRVNANYEVYIDEPGECIDICFQTAAPIEADCFIHYFESNARIRGLFVQLERLWRLKHEGYYHRCMALVYEILTEWEKEAPTYRPSREERLLRPAVDYLEEHFLDEIEYSHLSSLCDISDSYFRKLFHLKYKMSPIQFVTCRKIRYACELLSTGQYTVTQVADLMRYDNVYYFSKVFKQVMGIPPIQYAKSLAKNRKNG